MKDQLRIEPAPLDHGHSHCTTTDLLAFDLSSSTRRWALNAGYNMTRKTQLELGISWHPRLWWNMAVKHDLHISTMDWTFNLDHAEQGHYHFNTADQCASYPVPVPEKMHATASNIAQAWKRVRGEKGERDITPLGGSGGMLPRKNIFNIPYFKASIWCILRGFFCQPGESWRNLTSAMSPKLLWPPY